MALGLGNPPPQQLGLGLGRGLGLGGEYRPVDDEDLGRGIIGTILHETAADVTGFGKTAGAAVFSPFALLGASVPITFDDLTKRDLKGFGMMLAMGAGGALAGAAKGVPLIRAIGTGTALQRMGTTAASEAVAGAGFGLTRSLFDPDADPLTAIAGDTLLFGGFGAGASMLKSATMATVGGAMARAAEAHKIATSGKVMQGIEGEKVLSEYVGINLRNPLTGARIQIARSAKDKNKIFINELIPNPKAPEGGFSTAKSRTAWTKRLDTHLAKAVEKGYTENVGGVKFIEDILSEGVENVPADFLKMIQEGALPEGQLAKIAEGIQLENYQAVREVAAAAHAENALTGNLAYEAMLERVGQYGQPNIAKSTREEWMQAMPLTDKEKLAFKKKTDGEFIREAMLHGVLRFEDIQKGAQIDQYLKELVYNGRLGSSVRLVNPLDTFAKWFLTSGTVAKLHPVVKPLVDASKALEHTTSVRRSAMEDALWTAEEQVKKLGGGVWDPKGPATKEAAKIIDNSVDKALAMLSEKNSVALFEMGYESIETVAEDQLHDLIFTAARDVALAEAKSSGNPQVNFLVEHAQKFLDDHLARFKSSGRITAGIPGYLNIVNNPNFSKWKVEGLEGYNDDLKKFIGDKIFYDSEAEAKTAINKWLKTRPNGLYAITPMEYVVDSEAAVLLKPEGMDKLTRKMVEAMRTERTKKGFLKPRRLGLRLYEDVGWFDRLRIYGHQAERLHALDETQFAKVADDVLSRIPAVNPQLQAWATQLRDDLLGKPRASENAFQAIMQRISPNTKPRALQRYSVALRKWESFARLSGPMSGIVNLTQIVINTVPIVGPIHTTRAIKDIFMGGPKKLQEIRDIMRTHNVDLSWIAPLSAEGGIAKHATIRGMWKKKEYGDVINAMGLFLFNSAERMNRTVTWWASYQKALSKKTPSTVAAALATNDMMRTQFDYAQANMPDILRGPIGALLLQFKSFFINELEFVASLEGKEAARFAGAMMGLGGLAMFTNLPGIELIDKGKGMLFNSTMEEDITTSTATWLPKWAAFGLPGVADVDLHDYVGVSGFAELTRGFLGPIGSDVTALKKYIGNVAVDNAVAGRTRNETHSEFLKQVLPSAIRRAMSGYEVMQSGEVRNPYTKKLIYKADARIREGLPASIGFPTIRLQQERALDRIHSRITDRWTKSRTSFAKEAALAIIDGEEDKSTTILQQAEANGFPISRQSVKYWVQELQRTSGLRRYRTTPVALRGREEMLRYWEANLSLPPEIEQRLGLGGL